MRQCLARRVISARSLSLQKDQQSFASTQVLPKRRILSGVQPTGSLHLGNYLGAIKQWVTLQHEYESFFFVVDLHAVTVPQDPAKLRQETLQAAAMYIAAGIDPKNSTIFIQSHVSAHAELTWLFNCMTPISWLERMIQYKEKSVKQGETTCVGLFDYPVLMAADILLYQADLVPVGEDQRQHLELARDIARRFNDLYPQDGAKNNRPQGKQSDVNKRLFKEPTAMIVKEGARVMSLTDGTSKMSKSAENDNSRINLLDSADEIQKKIKRCKTDANIGLEWDNPQRPEAANLLNILQAVTGQTREDIIKEVHGMTWGSFKPHLADAVISHLAPIQRRYAEVLKEKNYLEDILHTGQQRAEEIAQVTLRQAKNAMGLYLPETKSRRSL
jgi:tryptophanyl-tRNA synthetase